MRVDVRVVFADLADKGFRLVLGRVQEGLLRLEDFFLDVARRLDVEHTGQLDEQEFLVVRLRSGKADSLEHGIDTSFYLPIEAVLVMVVNNRELGVTHPGVDESFVEGDSLIDRLVSCLVVNIRVELRSAISRRDHVDHSLISSIAQLDSAPVSFI